MVLIHPVISLETRTLSITVPAYLEHLESTHTISLDLDLKTVEMESDYHIWGGNHSAYSVGDEAMRDALSNFMGKRVLLVQKGDSVRGGGYSETWTEDLNISLDYPDGCAIKFNDAFPILLVSESSLAEVQSRINTDSRVSSERWGKDMKGIEIERFRGNIVLSGAEEWDEDGWNEITIGEDNNMVIAARCARCMVSRIFSYTQGQFRNESTLNSNSLLSIQLPNVDPSNGIRDKVVPDMILRPYVRFHRY